MKRVKFFFATYDFWIGVFWDSKKRKIYIAPLPMCVFCVELKDKK